VLACLLAGTPSSPSHAQIVTNIGVDGTLPVNTTVTPSGTVYTINGGTIKGTNQFHSFSRFSVGAGDIADFTGPNTIQNIVSRVTGGTRSDIDGTLRSTIPGANLFLLNPRGIFFGPNASLQVQGSFHASTADYIALSDGVRFSAIPSPTDALLTSASPAAFGFLGANVGQIDVQTGTFTPPATFTLLQVPPDKTLSLVAGAINLGAANGTAPAYVTAPRGTVNLATAVSGEVALDATGLNVNAAQLGGVITIAGRSIIDAKQIVVRGGRLVIDNAILFPGFFPPGPPPNGGIVDVKVSNDVTIRGTASQPLFATPGIRTLAGTTGNAAPDISVEAPSLTVSGVALIQSDRMGAGNPAQIVVTADTVNVLDGASMSVNNLFAGPGGSLTINAQEVLLSESVGNPRFTGLAAQGAFNAAYSASNTNSALTLADSGTLTVNASKTLTVRGGAEITTDSFAFGRAGDITINAGDMVLSRDGATSGKIASQSILAGNGGNITINATGQITMTGGFQISASTGGSGDGGSINVNAAGPISISGTNSGIFSVTLSPPESTLNATTGVRGLFGALNTTFAAQQQLTRTTLGIPQPDLFDVLRFLRDVRGLIAVNDLTVGDAGKISVTTPQLSMNAGARIDSSTFWNGNAGEVLMNLGSLRVGGGSVISSGSGGINLNAVQIGTGNSGTVTVTASDTISISGPGSTISTTTFGNGNAGSISLSANEVDIQSGGRITSDSGGILGGQLFAGGGRGGDINIAAPQVNILDGAGISASSRGTATALAGNVNLVTDNLTMQNASITTQSALAEGGNISVITNGSQIYLLNSQITTSVQSGVGSGGNITLGSGGHPVGFIILNGSQVRADAFGGPGGNIRVFADTFLAGDSVLSASSALSAPGVINIQAKFTDLSGNIAQLPETVLQAASLLRAACAARLSAGKASSLVVSGREGVPLEPGGVMPSPLIAESPTDLGPSRSASEWEPLSGAWRVSLHSKCSM
jgi:filamentous hemagglutinin family protein